MMVSYRREINEKKNLSTPTVKFIQQNNQRPTDLEGYLVSPSLGQYFNSSS